MRPSIKDEDSPQSKPKAETLKRCSSLSSISSADSIDNDVDADTKPSDEKARIRRCKITLSPITDSSLKRSHVVNSTLATLLDVKWSHITNSKLTNILTLKRAKIESATVSNVVDIRRATITNSTISDVLEIKKSTAQNSSLRRVALLERATIKNCVVKDCIISKTDFEGMVLENGIWQAGRLVGRIDQEREVVFRPLEQGESPEFDEHAGKSDDVKEEKVVTNVDDSLLTEHMGDEKEGLLVNES